MKHWFAVNVDISSAAADAIEFAFNSLGALGTQIDTLRKKPGEAVTVVGYFEESPEEPALTNEIAHAFAIYDIAADTPYETRIETVEDQDWLAEWKKHWQPTTIGRFVIAPPWSDVGKTDNLVIRIEPNMAFGTGTHETTQLCLRAIDDYFREGMSMLDVGTGTGILSIGAAKVSPSSHIVACDVDTDSVKIAKENAAANHVAKTIEFFEGSVDESTPTFDFVAANLTLDVISPLLTMLVAKARQILLLSGILAEQEGAIRNELSKFEISDLRFSYSGEWLSVIVTKNV